MRQRFFFFYFNNLFTQMNFFKFTAPQPDYKISVPLTNELMTYSIQISPTRDRTFLVRSFSRIWYMIDKLFNSATHDVYYMI